MRPGLLLSIVLIVACDAAPSDPPPDAAPVDLGVDAPLVDMTTPITLTVGAACRVDDVPCARGACVHGICSIICNQTSDCPSDLDLVCVGRGGAGRCTPRCSAAGDCAPGQICAVQGPDSGFCVAPGPGAGGAPCTSREDCASWICADDQCAQACDAAGCPADARCLALHTQAICVPVGPGADEVACRTGAECQSGICRGGRCSTACGADDCPNDRICVRYDSLDLCERRCATSDDCGESGICQAGAAGRLCATRGPTADGVACVSGAACASGRCQAGQCATRCPDGDCPAGRACVTDVSGAICRLAGGAPFGAACESGGECVSGICGGGRCALDCADGACPAGARCTRFADGRFCFFPCADDDDCTDAARCDQSFAEGPTCFWRGEVADGEACDADGDCASGRCFDGRCSIRCPTGDCPGGTLCTDFDTVALCAPAPLPEGAACGFDAECADGRICAGGRCLPGCAAGCPAGAICVGEQCQPTCVDEGDCAPGLMCDRFDASAPFCALRGAAAAGEACVRAGDCRSGLCFDGLCRAGCSGACGAGESCVGLAGGAWCLPTGDGTIGDACVANGTCRSGLCVGQRCAAPCPTAGGCPAETRCRALRAGGFCVADCDPIAGRGCAAEEACAPYPEDVGGLCVPLDDHGRIGEPCARDDACTAAAIGCLPGADGTRCRAPCQGDGDCPAPMICAPLDLDAVIGACLPGGAGGDLAPCARRGDCAAGWCLRGYLDGRCGRRCAADGDCGEGARCVDLARNPEAPFRVCAPACADGVCPEGLACRQRIDGAFACY